MGLAPPFDAGDDANAGEEPVPNVLPPTPLERLRAWLGPAPSYALTRFVLLRLLGLVYLMAFLVAARQIVPLVGHDGLTPADDFITWGIQRFGSRGDAFWKLPSLFWWGISDGWLVGLAWVGVVLSLVLVAGFANSILLVVLWALYMSFVHIGQVWYGYGWEIQLLETGLLAAFLVPLFDPRPFPRRPPPTPVIWLYRWLIFRIMLGAGLIKLRGDPCWRDLTCLVYHYETQPVPNPLSPFFHAMPRGFHQLGVLYNHLCELVLPVFVFGPRRARHIAGALMLFFQVTLILSGNLSFLNWLTIVPIIACFDDSLLRRLLPRRLVAAATHAAESPQALLLPQKIAVWAYVGLVALLSLDPVANLLSARQRMNTSFQPLALVNTYGAFGSVGKERQEIIFEGSPDGTTWTPYEFPCKPGDPHRRPCLMSPYHYRLDWQIWFAAMGPVDDEPWTIHLVWKLLHNDPGALRLLAKNPFPGEPPRWVRARLFRYRFAPRGDPAVWRRELIGDWLPALSADDPNLIAALRAYGWIDGVTGSGPAAP